jgi:hypothetical protein
MIIVMVGVAALVLQQLVRELVGSVAISWAAAFVLPLTAGVTGTVEWYSGAAEPIPAMPLTLGAMLLQLRFVRRGRAFSLIGSLVLLFASLAFDERAIALVATFPVLLLVIEAPRRWKRVITLEVAAVLSLAIYLVAQRYFTQQTPPTQRPGTNVIADFVFRGLIQNTLPSLIGIPTRTSLPGAALTAVGLVVLAGLILTLIVVRHRRVTFVVIWFLGLAIVLFAATGWVRAAEFGASSALEPRYAVALMPVGLIAAATVTVSLFENRPRSRRWVAISLIVAIAVAATTGIVSITLNPAGGAARDWWARVETYASSHPHAAYFDVETPPAVVPSAFFPASLLSNVAGVLDPTIDVDPTTRTAIALTPSGSAVHSTVASSGVVKLLSISGLTESSLGCWQIDRGEGSLLYNVGPTRTAERTYIRGRLDSTGSIGLTVVGATTAADASKGFGGSAKIGARSGVSWFTAGISRQKVGVIRITMTGQGAVCITHLTAGKLAPVP